jgi:hypothetical protein
MALEPPPNRSFETQDEAIDQFLRDLGHDHGFGVAVKRSIMKDRHGIVYKVNLRYDKGRKFTSTATKIHA